MEGFNFDPLNSHKIKIIVTDRDKVKDNIEALKKTIESYKELIKTGNAEMWGNYGKIHSCRMCKVNKRIETEQIECESCILNNMTGSMCSYDCWTHTASRLLEAINNKETKEIQRLAQARLNEILNHIKNHPISEYKNCITEEEFK